MNDVMQAHNEITNYVYHLYGDDEIFYTEALYSIGTLLKQSSREDSRIVVFTDRPERFRSMPVICESIADEIEEMKGPCKYPYRVKVCCILKCAEMFPGNIIYLDCDTIVKKPLREAADALGHGYAMMYSQEKLAGRFPQFEGFEVQFLDGTKYSYGPESWMFNAGVIGIHREDAKFLKNALVICDNLLLQNRRNHVCEQFAVSEALRIAGLKIREARKWITHYYRGSAKQYMHDKFPEYTAHLKKELWNFDRPLPYSYPRVQLHKWKRRMRGEHD
jgi:hypothetical protein